MSTFHGKVYMAWRGARDDKRLWWSRLDGDNWQPQQPIEAWSDTGPGLTTPDGEGVVMAWKGANGDSRIWYSQYYESWGYWSAQAVVGPQRETFRAPSLA